MQKLVIASHNPGKVAEFKKLLADWPFEIIGLADLNIEDDVEETGKTFQDNALLKADFFHQLTGLPTLADDGGMEIDALNGEPGVKSRRWRGYTMTDQEMVDYTLKKLQGVPTPDRTCRLKVVLCLIMPNQDPIFTEGSIEGVMTDKQELPISEGYPFRSIFRVTKLNKLYGELTDEEHNQVSQRLKALNKLRTQL
jgi:XTP/dITP diphosphohydrolase